MLRQVCGPKKSKPGKRRGKIAANMMKKPRKNDIIQGMKMVKENTQKVFPYNYNGR